MLDALVNVIELVPRMALLPIPRMLASMALFVTLVAPERLFLAVMVMPPELMSTVLEPVSWFLAASTRVPVASMLEIAVPTPPRR